MTLALWLALSAHPAEVGTHDLLATMDLEVNAAGPCLVRADPERHRVVVANTLSSTLTLVDTRTGAVTNVPVGLRALQHLKDAALAVRRLDGTVYLVADGGLVVVEADGRVSTVPTPVQLEAVAVDEHTGNAFLSGRESADLYMWDARRRRLRALRWLTERTGPVVENQTPPPPIRLVVALSEEGRPGRIAAVDGLGAVLYLVDARTGRTRSTRELPLAPGGRWHLAGADSEAGRIYLVTETLKRQAVAAARVEVDGGEHVVVELPGYTEPAGITWDPVRDLVLVPYDNHPSVHAVGFEDGGSVEEIAIPAYGNDGSALDPERGLLYVASWASGTVEVVDLEARRFLRRIEGLGIIPHMFAFDRDPETGHLWFPVGASAVNGTFGAAVSHVDPESGEVATVRTGFAPMDLVVAPERGGVLVFGSEDRMVEIRADGEMAVHTLPHRFPTRATRGPEGEVVLAYGPHQSYWPTVYIWAARNGLLSIDPDTLDLYDRRLPRQPLDLALDSRGALWLPQNNWGREQAFLNVVADGVRVNGPRDHVELGDEVERETTQRALRYDPAADQLFLVRSGEEDPDPSVLQVVDAAAREVVARVEVGAEATDLAFDEARVYVAAFGDGAVWTVDRGTWEAARVPAGDAPLAVRAAAGRAWSLDHLGGALHQVGGPAHPVPCEGHPDGLWPWGERLVVSAHSADTLCLAAFDPATGGWEELAEEHYPYGATRFDTGNAAFHMRGQFGDAVLTLTRAAEDAEGRLWVTDFLSGRVLAISP